MTAERVKPSLEIDEDIKLHEKGWIIQRIGWGLLFIMIVAAAAGLFGSGILSSKKVIVDGNVIEYDRFTRRETQTELKVYGKSENGTVQFSIPQHYLSAAMELEKITPEPEEISVKNGSLVYRYTFSEPAVITLYLQPKKAGDVEAHVMINESRFTVSQFVYP